MIDMNTAEFIASLGRERELQAEAARLRNALGEVLEVVNAAIYQPPALCQVREIVTDALQGQGDRVTL
jgi:hypothetical protein